ncbi:hypothetical protein AOQ84DRAFT_26888 [Glonium stellatum]|uniref:BTB domain-containing protein n=1 Tax=Glonium stellatum TaxID=574774 RepID=A0A8E2JU37_9PEZI|nr:hypothetical protein AOQ84DRAFT_26888 [Glonium stellatum]
MGHWQDRLVYVRDFAYTPRRLRMANGNIGDAPASTFAEYVKEPPSELVVITHLPDTDSASEEESGEESELDALAGPPSQSHSDSDSSLRQPRPLLAHRVNSHRLHVQAKAKSQRARLLSGPLIDIYVGQSKRHWALHRNLLCHHSEQLASILLPPNESKRKPEGKLELPDVDPSGFELLVRWLYQGKLDDVSTLPDPYTQYEYAVSCHNLYMLCDRFDMPQLKNIAMDQYRKGLNEARLVPDAAEMNEIYRKSGPGSPFRRLITKIAARQIMDPDSEKDAESYRECFDNNPDFAIDLVNAIKVGTGGLLFDDPTDGVTCEYHDHDAGPNCHIRGKGRVKQGK